jgi:hypothetical protein
VLGGGWEGGGGVQIDFNVTTCMFIAATIPRHLFTWLHSFVTRHLFTRSIIHNQSSYNTQADLAGLLIQSNSFNSLVVGAVWL